MAKFPLPSSIPGLRRSVIIDGDDIAVETSQDVTAALEQNKRQRNEFTGYRDADGNHWHHFAHIPHIVIVKWLADFGVDVFNPDHEDAVFRLLNDPDWRHLRTTWGRI